MPRVGVPNNPTGANSFDHFAPEPAYGEATKNQQLARSAPMAGADVASGPIAAPRRASRRAKGARPAAQAAPAPVMPPQAADQTVAPEARVNQWWQGIAQIPGASDLVKAYAGLLNGAA